jgi:polar amino acid transport system substrate-binding protein
MIYNLTFKAIATKNGDIHQGEKMRKTITTLIFILITIILYSNETIIIPVGEWAPYTSENEPEYGIICRIATAAFKEVDIEVEYEWVPWKRAFAMLKRDEHSFCSIGWAKNEERKRFVTYSETPIMITKNVFFHRKDNPIKFTSYKDLKGLTMGTTTGYAMQGAAEKAIKENYVKVDESASEVSNFWKILKRRIDIYPTSYHVGMSILEKNFTKAEIEQFTTFIEPDSDTIQYLIVSKKYPKANELLLKFEKGLKIIKEKGIYDEIVK